MRRTWITAGALTTTTAIALGAAGAGSGIAAKPRTSQISCGLELIAQGPLQGTPPTGVSFGHVTCSSPFGKGVHYDSATVTPTSPGSGSIAVRFKNYYNAGTTSGTVAGTFSSTSPTDITYTGTVTYTRGTGRFKRVRGGGTNSCTTTDGGAHKACTVHSKVTGV
jgi:hypothetical protein